jgi:hypothetical protein
MFFSLFFPLYPEDLRVGLRTLFPAGRSVIPGIPDVSDPEESDAAACSILNHLRR